MLTVRITDGLRGVAGEVYRVNPANLKWGAVDHCVGSSGGVGPLEARRSVTQRGWSASRRRMELTAAKSAGVHNEKRRYNYHRKVPGVNAEVASDDSDNTDLSDFVVADDGEEQVTPDCAEWGHTCLTPPVP